MCVAGGGRAHKPKAGTSQAHQARGGGRPPRPGRQGAFSADEAVWPAVLLESRLGSREGCGRRLWGRCGCCVNISLGTARTPREDRGSPHPACPPPCYTSPGRGTLGSPGQQLPCLLAQPCHCPGAKLQHPFPGTCLPQWAPQTQASTPLSPAPLQSGREDRHRRARRAVCLGHAPGGGREKTAHLF